MRQWTRFRWGDHERASVRQRGARPATPPLQLPNARGATMDDVTRHHAVEWDGALDLLEENGAIRPSRIPPGTAYQLPLTTQGAAMMCSGVRIALRSDARELRLVGKPLRFSGGGLVARPAIIDLVVNQRRVDRQETEAGVMVEFVGDDFADYRVEDRGSCTLTFTDLPAGSNHIEIWLPHGAQFAVETLYVSENSVVERRPSRPRWIHYGSSISHCTEADGPSDIWAAVAARSAGLCLTNIGLGGECHVDQFVARYVRDQPAELLSFKLGINVHNTLVERTFRSAVHGFLDTVRDGHSTTPIVICSPIWCPDAETNMGPLSFEDGVFRSATQPIPFEGALTLVREREILEEAVASRIDQGDEHLYYLHGHELFGPDDEANLPDRLHPNGEGYIVMGERFASKVLGPAGLVSHYSL